MSERIPPYIVTERDLIKNVVSQWEGVYGSGRHGDDSLLKKLERLRRLDLDTVSASEINSIIGNATWTTDRCSQCGGYSSPVIVVGQVPDYESSTATLCRPCFDEAAACWNGADR